MATNSGPSHQSSKPSISEARKKFTDITNTAAAKGKFDNTNEYVRATKDVLEAFDLDKSGGLSRKEVREGAREYYGLERFTQKGQKKILNKVEHDFNNYVAGSSVAKVNGEVPIAGLAKHLQGNIDYQKEPHHLDYNIKLKPGLSWEALNKIRPEFLTEQVKVKEHHADKYDASKVTSRHVSPPDASISNKTSESKKLESSKS